MQFLFFYPKRQWLETSCQSDSMKDAIITSQTKDSIWVYWVAITQIHCSPKKIQFLSRMNRFNKKFLLRIITCSRVRQTGSSRVRQGGGVSLSWTGRGYPLSWIVYPPHPPGRTWDKTFDRTRERTRGTPSLKKGPGNRGHPPPVNRQTPLKTPTSPYFGCE